jgi:chemotaxis protein methyltransferase CheR
MIERTRAATYTDFEVHRGLDSGRQAKHMIRGVDSWRVHPEVRALVEASTQNLAMPWPARPRFDLILMRNVLVYLAPAVRAAILARTREALSPDGVLVLGAAESGTVPGFDRTTTGGAVFYRSSTRSCHVPPE